MFLGFHIDGVFFHVANLFQVAISLGVFIWVDLDNCSRASQESFIESNIALHTLSGVDADLGIDHARAQYECKL